MATPTYTEDLIDIDLAEAVTNWAESSDGAWDDGGSPAADADYSYLQGSVAISQQMTKATICSLFANNGAGITLPTDGAYFVWQMYASPTGIDTFANGGMRIMVGSGLGDFKSWDVGGSDYGKNPYGGWQNHAVNPTVAADDTVGTPTTTEQYVGAACKSLVGIGKGNPHIVDAVRYGRGSSIFEDGDVSTPATFAGFAVLNDAISARWGLIQAIEGGYFYKGKMTLGSSGTAVYFKVNNIAINIDPTPKVTANFNTIEINNAGTYVYWTNVRITALGTVSPGRLVVNNNAYLIWDLCQFDNMGAFTFGGINSQCINAAWRNCGIITLLGADVSGSSVSGYEGTADTSVLIWDVAIDPDTHTDGMIITKGIALTHAFEFGTTSPLTMTLRNIDFSGYNASDAQNDSTLHILRTSGTVTINLIGCTGNISYKSAGATIDLVINPVTTSATVTDSETKTAIQHAAVFIKAKDGTGPLPFEDIVTITRSGDVATVNHTAHGLSTNQKVEIIGAVQDAYNRIKTITKIDTNSYSYAVLGSPTTPATGTIKSTGVLISGETDASGQISDNRTLSGDQPFTGDVKKGNFSPTYKTSPLDGTVDSSTGISVSVPMVSDS